ncbi:UDP-glycosyltransferase [Melia azedarach]|uniref:UDP-glycosyltransferase n=1 Tax=Melia azedarach TaxID=155640 RepID=A0ACC1X6G8_MELAZ|nr:UDP-glycosyltransferase [Melia azedarach]
MSITSTRIVVIPYPAQGHVIPLLEFSQCLAEYGFRVTFVNSEYYHRRVLKSLEGKNYIGENIDLVSIPDGLEPLENRTDLGNLTQKLLQVMPGKLGELIDKINGREGKGVDCIIADGTMGWAIEVAEKMNIKRAAVWTASAASLALSLNIPKLIDDGIIDSNGEIFCLGFSVFFNRFDSWKTHCDQIDRLLMFLVII